MAVNHSIPDALAVAIRTGAGLVLHTGDFKMDQLPLDGRITDLRAFARLGEEGVDLFLTDSTNAETPGFTPAEKSITPVIDRVFHESQQRIIVACFASHVHRVQQVLDAAYAHERQVAYVGRSMVRNMAIARDLGYLKVPPGVLVDTKDLADLPPERQVLISTGSQGEPMSALSRIAQRNHNFVHIEEGDTVLLASSLIPGNENAVYRVINGLARWGANVVHKGNALVHVSGHASAGELLYCYNIVKPKNVLPVHGEIRHMRANADLARATGVRERRDRRGRRRRRPGRRGRRASPARSTAATSSSTAPRSATSPSPTSRTVGSSARRGSSRSSSSSTRSAARCPAVPRSTPAASPRTTRPSTRSSRRSSTRSTGPSPRATPTTTSSSRPSAASSVAGSATPTAGGR